MKSTTFDELPENTKQSQNIGLVRSVKFIENSTLKQKQPPYWVTLKNQKGRKWNY